MANGSDRRRTIRLRAGEGAVLIEAEGPDGGDSLGFPLVDISEGGICFLIPSTRPPEGGPPEVGESLTIAIELPRLDRPLKLAGVVRRVNEAGGFGGQLVGLQFVDMDEWQRSTIRGAVIEVARERIEEGYHILQEGAGRAPGIDEDDDMLRLGDVLVEREMVKREALEALIQAGGIAPLGRTLVRAGAISEWQLVQALAAQAGLQAVDLRKVAPSAKTGEFFTPGFLMVSRAILLEAEDDALKLAVASIPPEETMDEIRRSLGGEPELCIASETQIAQALHSICGTGGRTRRHPRVAAEVPLVFSLATAEGTDSDAAYEGVTQDLSQGGFLFAGPAPSGVTLQSLLNTAGSVRLRARFGEPDEVVEAVCSPVRISEMPAPPDHWLYAVSIDEISAEHLERLKLFQFYQRFKSDGAADTGDSDQ